nr:MAG TPA: hypothetical protein [Caudoviricetes sp.]
MRVFGAFVRGSRGNDGGSLPQSPCGDSSLIRGSRRTGWSPSKGAITKNESQRL